MHADLNTMTVRLRPPRDDDVMPLAAIRGDESSQSSLMAHPEARAADDTAEWLTRRANDASGRFFIVEEENTCVGFVQLTNLHRLDRRAFFGIALVKGEQGRGIGRQAMRLLIDHARGIGLRKLLCEVRVDNTGAASLYASLGFVTVGRLRDHYCDGTRWWDATLMEQVLKDDA